MAESDVLDEVVFDSRNSSGNDLIRRDDKVEAAGDHADLGTIAAVASMIFSIPGCEQPTTSTAPFGVLMASDNSFNSLVPGASDTSAINVTPGVLQLSCR